MNRQEQISRCEWLLINRCTPKTIEDLSNTDIFVFGSNPGGHHRSGTAKIAVDKFGAVEGQGEGLSGNSYAIPVHKHHVQKMTEAVSRFIDFATSNTDKIFYILPIGCGKANMDVCEVSQMFKRAVILDNVYLPNVFINALIESLKYNNLKQLISDSLSIMNEDAYTSIGDGKAFRCIPKGRIAIIRDYAIMLDDNGRQIRINEDQEKIHSSEPIKVISGTFDKYVGVTVNGKIVSSGKKHEFYSTSNLFTDSFLYLSRMSHSDVHKMKCKLSSMAMDKLTQNMFVNNVSAGEGHIAAILSDGNISCINTGNGGVDGIPDFQKFVKDWYGCIQVAVGFYNIIGLNKNGHVFYHVGEDGGNNPYVDIDNAIQVDAYSHYYGDVYSIVLKSDGTVESAYYKDVSSWKDIVQVAIGWDVALGLRIDGKVEIVGCVEGMDIVAGWTNIVYIETKFSQIIAVRDDGEILNLYIH